MTAAVVMPRLVKLPEVMHVTGLSRPTIYRWSKADKFPRPVRVGRASRWREDELRKWIEQRTTESQQVA